MVVAVDSELARELVKGRPVEAEFNKYFDSVKAVSDIDRLSMERLGLRNVTEAAQGAVGVTAGDGPAEPAGFSMRGFTNSQINTLYNGIKIGPQNMTSRVMDTANLERIEIQIGRAHV